MHRLMALLILAFFWLGCGVAPEPTSPRTAAFTCAHVNSFTHLCDQYVPSSIPGSPTNGIPAGDPQWCPANNSQIPDGWAMVLNDQPVAGGRYCNYVPPGYYRTLGDWDYTSTSASVPSVHVRAILTGANAGIYVWDQPDSNGNFIGYYGPGSVVTFTSTVRSFEFAGY